MDQDGPLKTKKDQLVPKMVWFGINLGRNYIRPPPPLSPFLAKRHFSGEGGGVYFGVRVR